MKLFTIGHSNHSLNKFIRLLDESGIMMLVDVRTSPYSRYSPHFNKDNLERELPEHEIQYVFAGKYLGGRPSDPGCYKQRVVPKEGVDFLNEVDYPEVMKRKWFKQAIERLLEIVDEQTTAIMCSEEDPAECHRHHLIAKYLISEFPEVEVRHIRGDGTEYNAKTILTSVNKPDANQPTLF
jgi:uncharacterized protein (DUF488 family)